MNSHRRTLQVGSGLLLLLVTVFFGAVAGQAQSNLVLMISPPGEYIGQGQTYYTTNLGEFSATLYPGPQPASVRATAFGFFLTFAAPNNALLTVGTYSNAVRYPFHGSNPGLSISGNGRGCNGVCGSFQIYEIATDGSGNLTRFWATFTQRCECGGAPLTGEIRFHSTLAPATPLPRTLRVPLEYPTIQVALDSVNIFSVDQVLVDPGLYEESIQFGGKRAQLLSTGGPNLTYLMATGGVAIAFGGATPESLVSGFTLMDSVTGISISAGGSPTIVSNAIVNCGTGIDCNSGSSDNRGSPVIRGNSIVGCAGAAIQLSFTGTPLIEANNLEDNGGGVGMWEAGNPTIRNNIIRRNRGDGFWMYNYSSADIIQNLIVENRGVGVGWLAPQNSRGPWLINNTIAGNGGPGISASTYGDGVQIINNIVVGDPAIAAGANPPVMQFNNFYSRAGNPFSGLTNQTGLNGNISADPFFVCEPAGDYRLLAGSLCIDAGTNDAPLVPGYDFDGLTRPLPASTNGAARIDLGAFEFNPANPATNPCLFVYCPDDIVVIASPGANTAVVSFPAPFATPGATVTNFPVSGSVFPQGTNTVMTTVTYGTNVLQCSFTVTVLVAPNITMQPQGLAVLAGATTNLSVSVQGSPALRYQWLFENSLISGATNFSLSLTNLQANHEGYYRVIITNTAGAITSAPALIRVLPAAPRIFSGPAALTVAAGSNATFQVNAGGSNPLGFQWYRDGSPYAFTAAPQLVISNAQTADMGNFQVVVSNLLGSVTSSVVSLVVTAAAPKIVTQPTMPPGGLLTPGSSYTLSALARGSEPISYQWRRSNTNLPGLTNLALVLSNVTTAVNGSYTVLATNAYGSVTSAAVFISVSGLPPTFTQQPASREVLEGSTVTFNSLASGTTPLAYQWKFYGTNLPNQTNRQLTLIAVTPARSGPYFVTASNAVGATNSLTAQLTVNQSLVLTQPLSNQVVDAGTTLSLAVEVASTGPHSYFWQCNGQNLAGTTSTLSLTNVQLLNSGFYRVVVSNQFGTLTSTGRVSVFGPPSAVVAWGDDSASQTTIPTNLNDVVAISGGDFHTVALRRNGGLLGWGYNLNAQISVPTNSSRFVTVVAGAEHNVAVTEAGDVVAWGRNEAGQCNVPSTARPALMVAAGDAHSLALRASGTVAAWGDNSFGQTTIPGSLNNVRAIAAGRHHNLALRHDGTVIGWGLNTFGQTSPPSGLVDVAAIAAGYLHSIALRSNGVVVAWGDNTFGQTNIPPQISNVVAVAAGDFHSFALLSDGQVVSWGNDWFGQNAVPATATGAWAIASGYYHNLALSPPQALNIKFGAEGVVVTWNGPDILQWSAFPAGPFQDLPGLSGCYTNSTYPGQTRFFRLKR